MRIITDTFIYIYIYIIDAISNPVTYTKLFTFVVVKILNYLFNFYQRL